MKLHMKWKSWNKNTCMMTLNEMRRTLEQRKGSAKELLADVKSLRKEIKLEKAKLENLEQARTIIRLVGLETQQQLQFHISDIASLALESIFPDPYKLVLDFVERRDKTECDIFFERNGERLKPIDSAGGGAVDVAAFALRIACWSMATKRTRNTIILDEPMRFLSEDYQKDASEMIKELSKKLGIQFIIVTHEDTLAESADKIFEVSIKKGVTKVK